MIHRLTTVAIWSLLGKLVAMTNQQPIDPPPRLMLGSHHPRMDCHRSIGSAPAANRARRPRAQGHGRLAIINSQALPTSHKPVDYHQQLAATVEATVAISRRRWRTTHSGGPPAGLHCRSVKTTRTAHRPTRQTRLQILPAKPPPPLARSPARSSTPRHRLARTRAISSTTPLAVDLLWPPCPERSVTVVPIRRGVGRGSTVRTGPMEVACI